MQLKHKQHETTKVCNKFRFVIMEHIVLEIVCLHHIIIQTFTKYRFGSLSHIYLTT